MTTVFRPTTSVDEPEVISLLQRAFPDDPDAPAFAPRLMRWKYWEPRDDWAEPRSYVLDRGGRIVAHAGLWPVTVAGSEQSQRGVHMMDWASDPNAPGAGISLLQRLTRSFCFIYSIGGSGMTLQILPKFGFHAVAEALTWARPLRPWRHTLQHQYKDARLLARLGRNLWWSKSPPRGRLNGWEAVPHEAVADAAAGERDDRFFHYLKQCPDVRCLTFRITHAGKPEGYFALSLVHQQARIAGVWLNSPTASNWRTAFELAQKAALRYTDACEITARGYKDISSEAAAAAGMRIRGIAPEPVLFYRRSGNTNVLPLDFQLADNDAVFRNEGTVRFAC